MTYRPLSVDKNCYNHIFWKNVTKGYVLINVHFCNKKVKCINKPTALQFLLWERSERTGFLFQCQVQSSCSLRTELRLKKPLPLTDTAETFFFFACSGWRTLSCLHHVRVTASQCQQPLWELKLKCDSWHKCITNVNVVFQHLDSDSIFH